MRLMPIKNIKQQLVLLLHRERQGFVKARTAQGNQIRCFLGEFGLIILQGIANIAMWIPEHVGRIPSRRLTADSRTLGWPNFNVTVI